ncbi:MAG: Hpt domain-containing protein [Myxococcales bacterium FL481]|nr:MAG: Hpt domain-containing protein [Myxococcales bacterium FL481]
MGPALDENTLAALRELADEDDPGFLTDLIDTYLQDSASSLAKLGEALAADGVDRDQTRRLAHTLKGASQNIGAIQMAARCLDLEKTAPSAAPAELREMLARAEEAFAVTRESLGRELARAS